MNEIKKHNTDLFNKVVSILEDARANSVRAVNSQMVLAYWSIGKEIVDYIQFGEERAKYGKQLIENLSEKLQNKYKRGFSTTNLWYFRKFYITFKNRKPKILHIGYGELNTEDQIIHIGSGELKQSKNKQLTALNKLQIAVEKKIETFSPELSWSHYRTLMHIENKSERIFYEIEAEKEKWDAKLLKHHIDNFLFIRLLKSKDKSGLLQLSKNGQTLSKPSDIIKSPYFLDFLGIPEAEILHEIELEKAIINNLQEFLLELGKGFAFVARQKRVQFDDKYFYIDLVFYNTILKCYLLIDLKIGELTHQDVGQIDSYVRMYDDKYITKGDNPTIGLILCSKKNETIVKYSVLNDNKQLFASKYMLYLPTEEELKHELKLQRQKLKN